MKAQKLPPYEIDVDTRNSRTWHLTPAELGVYTRLMDFYWRWGELPVEARRLAAIGAVHVRSFERMSATLIPLFEVDDAGIWRDPSLEEQRDKVMQGQARRSKAAALAAEERWRQAAAREAARREAAHQHERHQDGQEQVDDGTREHAIEPPDALRSALPNASPEGPTDASSALPDALRSTMRPDASHGSIDRSSVENSESIDRSNPSAGARETHADRTAEPALVTGIDGGSGDASRMHPASESASAYAAPAAPVPQSVAYADAGPSDAELCARVLSACGGNVTAELRLARDVEPIRALMRDGFDLDHEILPLLRDRVKAFRTPLRTLRAPWIKEALQKARAAGAGSARPPAASPAPVFVASGTAEWTSCQARERAEGRQPKKAVPNGKTGQTGNWFASPLPPVDRPAVAAE